MVPLVVAGHASTVAAGCGAPLSARVVAHEVQDAPRRMAGAQLRPQVSGEEGDPIFGNGGENGLGGVGPRVHDAPGYVVGRPRQLRPRRRTSTLLVEHGDGGLTIPGR